MKPNFLFIGPDKTGSSWIYEILRQHPECYVPNCKDIYFFDRYYDCGMDWYLSFFKHAPSEAKAVGEICHDYLFSPEAARRIHHNLPGVKLLTCLRNPVERTFSHYLYMIRSGRTQLPFEEALNIFPELIDKSLYYKHLSEYFRIFEGQQIKVLFFDNLKKDPRSFAKDVFDFLGISFMEEIDYHKKVRPASHPRSFFLAHIVKLGANFAREIGLTKLVGIIKHSTSVSILYEPYEENERPVMSPLTREKLQKIFCDDTKLLQDMLGINLNSWLS